MDDQVLDHATLDRLVEEVGGDPEFVSELIDTYLGETPELLRAIESANDAADADALRRAAHTLKSNSASLGAVGLAEVCAAIEHAAREGALATADQFGALRQHVDRMRDAFQAFEPGTR